MADHPRACGELGERPIAKCDLFGSSPRMRGTPTDGAYKVGLNRIIPAHAGNSIGAAASMSPKADHPRACGELLWVWETRHQMTGSSPRMRGNSV